MNERPLRILHLTAQRVLSAGQRKQLRFESRAAETLEGIEWTTLGVHTKPAEDDFDRRMPAIFRGLFLRSLYGWILTLRLAHKYDFVMVRHMPFDPFSYLFAPFVRNRLSVHHAKEIEELPLIAPGPKGRIAAFVERQAGAFAVRRTIGVLGVTRELAQYERDMWAPGKPCFPYPNAIDPALARLADDDRAEGAINVIFICGKFSVWHGLERLIDAVGTAQAVPDGLRIHLIGNLIDGQRELIGALGDRADRFVIHGYLDTDAYQGLINRADLGLTSFALDLKGLEEASTLKVRELLTAGVAVYSGHRDTALPDDFPYYRVERQPSVQTIVDIARTMKGVSRQTIREISVPFLSKASAMREVAEWLRSEFRS